ncbi:NAD-dependent epimerase/dehydratase family protein [Listeria booriae]|uniref:NAD-dependent epimerase/dehydratase family protein n=1 Tax=Listeria booriae TaxID=1552123 RepID=A0A841YSX0_9LIST|nr:NAD-dependent epimerase/dehydratase family protein [Listeria booriae]MBC1402837.1 NAD-dependent epimerase/dehydratase family protein [Listeria booriae]MBC1617611.1 NAD-dependent epimerase/dehydratase family protein [Listeria booriae]
MHILVTGKQGYVGTKFESWMAKHHPEAKIDLRSVRPQNVEMIDFINYDIVLHAAALVHRKETAESANDYQRINVELTEKLAEKAKAAGVKQFVFLSTVAVYGEEGSFDEQKIAVSQEPRPVSQYGMSKYIAEKRLKQLETADFHVAVIRPPMIYGPECPGNYARLAKLARKVPFFPTIEGERSMLFIDNLSAFLYEVMVGNLRGIYVPQNRELVNTTQLVMLIAAANGKKIKTSKLAGMLCQKALQNVPIFRKMFGNLVFEAGHSVCHEMIDLQDSITRTEINAS